MKRLKKLYLLLMTLTIGLVPWQVLAGGEGLDVPEALERKVPLEHLSGIRLFFCGLYNENLWLYAIMCTVLMAAVGMAIAYVADIFLRALGMDVTRIEHKE